MVRGACPHDCPDTCALRITVQDGRAVKVQGDPDHPPTHGALCTKVSRYAERTYHAERVLTPLKRVGAKGVGSFVPVSWDEALRDIAGRLRAIAARDPQAIVPYSYAGTMGLVQGESMAARFFNKLGASRLDRTICSSAGGEALVATYGAKIGMHVEHYARSKLLLVWGSNSIASNLHFWTFAQEAKRSGAKLICIDPRKTETADKCHQHIGLLPGTDGALALGIMHELIVNDWLDHDYIARHTEGWMKLRERALGWPPERAAATCGIGADEVRSLARDYATIRPAAIRLNYGMQRVRGGGNAARLVAILPCLVGAWRDAAGGMLLSSSGWFNSVRNDSGLQRPDLLGARRPRIINMSTIGDDLLRESDAQLPDRARFGPKIEALLVYNSNPVAVAPESPKVVQGFRREDLFTVVLEHFLTDTARYADVLLPATMQMEHSDLHLAYGHYHLQLNRPAVPPPGECRPIFDLFQDLAKRMGLTDPCFDQTFDDLVTVALDMPSNPRLAGITLERLERERSVPLASADPRLPQYSPFLDGRFDTPSGKVEFVSSLFKAHGMDPVLGALTSEETDPGVAAEHAKWPLHFVSPASRYFVNSSMVENERGRRLAKGPLLWLNEVDARARGIATGDTVRVRNDRGAWTTTAEISDLTGPGVVATYRGWWSRWTPDGTNANQTTSQRLTDAGGGATFYTNFVEVEKV